ncbi:Arsenical-resistance protein 2 [Ilyonectria robusta]
MASAAPQDTPPWWTAFPEAQATCPRVEVSEVATLLEANSAAGSGTTRDFLLVDVRRTDWEGGTVATSINLPAHTFYQTRAVIYQLCKQAGIRRIIFYCGEWLFGIRKLGERLLLTIPVANRKLWKQRPTLCRVDARLPQRGGGDRHQSRNPCWGHQGVAEGVRGKIDGLIRRENLGRTGQIGFGRDRSEGIPFPR